jgi:HNH endonuclease
MTTTCSIPDCFKKVHSKGLCQPHYRRQRRTGTTDNYFDRTVEERFLAFVSTEKTSEGCIQWIGSTDSKGHGKFWDGEKIIGAHKWAYEHFVGPVPEGLILDHTCHDPRVCRLGINCPHRACVNIEHVIPTTKKVNSSGDRSAVAASNKARAEAQTHCINEHEFTPENTTITKEGFRVCKTCNRERQIAYRNRQRDRGGL